MGRSRRCRRSGTRASTGRWRPLPRGPFQHHRPPERTEHTRRGGIASTTTGAEEDPRLPSAHLDEPPRAVALLLASWVILLQGALILIFLPVLIFTTKDVIAPGDIVSFGVDGVVCVVGGALVYVPRRWTWWAALAATVASGAYLLAVGGLVSAREGYVAAGFSAIAVVLLLLGSAAAGNTEALSL